MKNKKELLKSLVSRSIPVSLQSFDFTRNGEPISDQYIVDGPALRELLKSYKWNYKTIKKHRDWLPTFHWNGSERVDYVDEATRKRDEEFREKDREAVYYFNLTVGIMVSLLSLLGLSLILF